MKHLKLLMLVSITALFLMQCNTKKIVNDSSEVVTDVVTDTKKEVDKTSDNIEETIEIVEYQDIELDSPSTSSAVEQTRGDDGRGGRNPDEYISTTIKDYQTKSALSGVSIKIGEELICTSNESGSCDLTDINSSNTYTLSKANYLSQSVKFDNYSFLSKSDFYLKSSTQPFSKIHLKGAIKKGDGGSINNISIKAGGKVVQLQDGKFSIDISKSSAYSLEFVNGFDPSQVVKMTLNTNQDSVIVDVFIDGFNLQ